MVHHTAIRRSVCPEELPAFTPVPRQVPRHDGWTPERQRAFIEALADTGCVAVAARMVNMSKESAYQLRRQPGAASFRAAWDAAQRLGMQPVKDEAFDRAMNGQLVPVFVGGKLMGFRRKKNDALLMYLLSHHCQDGRDRKTTVNYFSTRATAGATALNPPRNGEGDRSPQANGGGVAAAEASTTTVKTVISGSGAQSQLAADDAAANALNAFEGVELDPEAQAEIYRTLEACAERRRALENDPGNDPERFFIGEAETNGYLGELESGAEGDWIEYKPEGEHSWEGLGEGGEAEKIDRVVGEMQARLAAETTEDRAAREAADDATSRAEFAKANKPLPGYVGGANPALPAPEPDPDDPRLDWRNWTDAGYEPPEDPPRNGGEERKMSGGHQSTAGRSLGERGCEAGPGGLPTAQPDAQHRLAPEANGGGVEAPTPDEPISPRTGWPLKRYKKRTPKPAFTPPTACPGPQSGETRKAEAAAEVEAERREGAAAEAERRRRRQP